MIWMHSLDLSKGGTCVSDAGMNRQQIADEAICTYLSYNEQSTDA